MEKMKIKKFQGERQRKRKEKKLPKLPPPSPIRGEALRQRALSSPDNRYIRGLYYDEENC